MSFGDKYFVPPLKIPSADWLRDKIDNFVDWCKASGHSVTWSALAVYLNCTTQTLANYRDKIQVNNPDTVDDKDRESNEEYISICSELSRARSICQLYSHDKLYDKETTRGAQFDLSANYGMSERTAMDIDSNGTIRLAPEVAELSK